MVQVVVVAVVVGVGQRGGVAVAVAAFGVGDVLPVHIPVKVGDVKKAR